MKVLSGMTVLLILLIPAALFYTFQKSIFYYQESNSLFIFSFQYLLKFLSKPGGVLEYFGLFLSQLYYNPFYGSLIFSGVIALVARVFYRISRQLSSEKSFSVIFFIIPWCLLMILQRRFDHLQAYNLGFLATGLWFQLSTRMDQKNKVFVPLMFPFLYYLAGSYCLLYVVMYFIYRIVYGEGSSKYMSLLMLVVSAIASFEFFKEIVFLQPMNMLIFNPLDKYVSSALPYTFILLSCYAAFLPLITRIFSAKPGLISIKIRGAVVLILFFISAFAVTRSVDPLMSDNVRIERFVTAHEWNEVIRRHENSPSESITGQYYYNLALAETGQLCERMFSGRQDFGSGSLIPHSDPPDDNEMYFYYTIGLVNEAHQIAVESFVKNGYRPEVIKTLIRTDLIKSRFREAQRFIDLLKRTLFYKRWAIEYEHLLSDTTLISLHPELGKTIRILPVNDFFIKPFDSLNLEAVIKFNPGNKAAFEYRMAGLLFEKKLQSIVEVAERMKENGYTYYPRYIEEAIAEERYVNNDNSDTAGIILNPSTSARFRKYHNDYDSYRGDDFEVFQNKMRDSWGDTYWFYFDFK